MVGMRSEAALPHLRRIARASVSRAMPLKVFEYSVLTQAEGAVVEGELLTPRLPQFLPHAPVNRHEDWQRVGC